MLKDCYFKERGIHHIDYKDVAVLKNFINPHARIQSTRRTNVSAKNQRQLAQAIKRARFMALMPFTNR